MIVHDGSGTGPSHEDAEHIRRRLLAAGVDRWLVTSTANIDLPTLMRKTIPHLTLVPDVDLVEGALAAKFDEAPIAHLGLPMTAVPAPPIDWTFGDSVA